MFMIYRYPLASYARIIVSSSGVDRIYIYIILANQRNFQSRINSVIISNVICCIYICSLGICHNSRFDPFNLIRTRRTSNIDMKFQCLFQRIPVKHPATKINGSYSAINTIHMSFWIMCNRCDRNTFFS